MLLSQLVFQVSVKSFARGRMHCLAMSSDWTSIHQLTKSWIMLSAQNPITVLIFTGAELLDDPETRGSSRSVMDHQPVVDRPSRAQWSVVIVGRHRSGLPLSTCDDVSFIKLSSKLSLSTKLYLQSEVITSVSIVTLCQTGYWELWTVHEDDQDQWEHRLIQVYREYSR